MNDSKAWAELGLTPIENRKRAYGSLESQIEYITENGLEPWQIKVADIKAQYPLTDDD